MSYKIAITIPTYNEAKNIERLIEGILEQRVDSKIIIVDDNSPDGTADLAEELAKKYREKIFVIRRESKLGIGSAYVTGFKYAMDELNSDLILSMDADWSHDPKYLPDFVKKINEGYDVVVGSRYVDGGDILNWNIRRRLISRGANQFARHMLGLNISDLTTGYRCYKKETLKSIGLDNIKSNGYSFLEEILFLCKEKGFRIGETPIVFVERRNGKSKLSKKEMIKFFITILRLQFGARLVRSKK